MIMTRREEKRGGKRERGTVMGVAWVREKRGVREKRKRNRVDSE